MQVNNDILQHLEQHFGVDAFRLQHTVDEILTLWLPKDKVITVIKYLKLSIKSPFNLLYDLSGTDERDRAKKEKVPAAALREEPQPQLRPRSAGACPEKQHGVGKSLKCAFPSMH